MGWYHGRDTARPLPGTGGFLLPDARGPAPPDPGVAGDWRGRPNVHQPIPTAPTVALVRATDLATRRTRSKL